jgi:hypothetical protein
MSSADSWKCIEDEYLHKHIKQQGERTRCSVCDRTRKAFRVDKLGEVPEPILREHIRQGREVMSSHENDGSYWEQQGDPLSFWVQEILGQSFGFEDEIVDAVIATEDVDPQHGDIPFFDNAADCEPTPVSDNEYRFERDFVLRQLKYGRRFFSSSAQALFDRLFLGIETIKYWNADTMQDESVVWNFPGGFYFELAEIL